MDLDSQECLVPIVEQPKQQGVQLRSKMPKQEEKKKEAIKISLSDCISCVGCVTSSEDIFIQTSNSDKLLELLQQTEKQLNILIPNIILLNIQQLYNVSLEQLQQIFKQFNQNITFYQDQKYIDIQNNNLYNEVKQSQQPILLTTCPAIRLYIGKKSHDKVYKQMCKSASYYECFYAENESQDKYCIAFSTCQDRKLESLKYQNSYCFTVRELIEVIGKQLYQTQCQTQQQTQQTQQQQQNNNLNTQSTPHWFDFGNYLQNKQKLIKEEINKNYNRFTDKEQNVTINQQFSSRYVENVLRNGISNSTYLQFCTRSCCGGNQLAITGEGTEVKDIKKTSENLYQIYNDVKYQDLEQKEHEYHIVNTRVIVDNTKTVEQLQEQKGLKVVDLQW